ncbi:RnfABCDGE type electron transport complex subunit G [bacterium]
MKDIIRLGSILFVVCVIAAGALAVVYKSTKPAILRNQELKRLAYRKSVLNTAKIFRKFECKENIYIGYNENNEEVGKVAVVRNKGYSGDIEIVLGADTLGKVTGIRIAHQTETPGLGNKIEGKAFLDQFKKLIIDEVYLKKDSTKGMIDSVTGATISSRAVTEGVRRGLDQISKCFVPDYKDGVYEGKVRGYGGIIRVKVTINNQRIVKIDAKGHYESKKGWQSILNTIQTEVIKNQRTQGINVITGATSSSKAYLRAVETALKESKK